MNLCIDIGNTTAKAALFDEGEMIVFRYLKTVGDIAELIDFYGVEDAIICSSRWELTFSPHPNLTVLTDSTPVPIVNRYATPATLGMDRLAAAVGAGTLCPGCNVMVVDLGTAITIDVVTAAGEFVGGNISAGLKIRLAALSEKTARLPLVSVRSCDGEVCNTEMLPEIVIADNTRDAILLGAINGIVYEIEGYREALTRKYGTIEVILTGGDASFFERRIKNTIFAGCNAVMIGLNAILTYNEKAKNEENP